MTYFLVASGKKMFVKLQDALTMNISNYGHDINEFLALRMSFFALYVLFYALESLNSNFTNWFVENCKMWKNRIQNHMSPSRKFSHCYFFCFICNNFCTQAFVLIVPHTSYTPVSFTMTRFLVIFQIFFEIFILFFPKSHAVLDFLKFPCNFPKFFSKYVTTL